MSVLKTTNLIENLFFNDHLEKSTVKSLFSQILHSLEDAQMSTQHSVANYIGFSERQYLQILACYEQNQNQRIYILKRVVVL